MPLSLTYPSRKGSVPASVARSWTVAHWFEVANLLMLVRTAFAFYGDVTATGPNLYAAPMVVLWLGFGIWRVLMIQSVDAVRSGPSMWLFRDGHVLWADVVFSFLMLGGLTASLWPTIGALAAAIPALLYEGVKRAGLRSTISG